MDAPDGEVDALRVQGLLPGQDVLIDAVDQRSVEIEQKDGLDAHGSRSSSGRRRVRRSKQERQCASARARCQSQFGWAVRALSFGLDGFIDCFNVMLSIASASKGSSYDVLYRHEDSQG